VRQGDRLVGISGNADELESGVGADERSKKPADIRVVISHKNSSPVHDSPFSRQGGQELEPLLSRRR
jgi:hypothetical protein